MPNINIGINADAATRGAKIVNKALGSIARRGSGLLNSVFTPLNAGIAALGGGASVVGLSKVSDQYTVMASRLEFLTGSAATAQEVQDGLFDISRKTGTQMEKNADTFTKLALASEMTGLTTEENLKVLGSLNALMLKTGTSGVQASAAMLQLSQALASGRLNGDEFRSMAENAPGVLSELARAIGVSRGELKEMSRQGELTSQLLGQAFLDISQTAKGSMERDLPETVQQGWNAIVLAFQRAWDIINDETGIMGRFRAMLFRIADWIVEKTPAFSLWFEQMTEAFQKNWPEIEAIFTNMVGWVGELLISLVESAPLISQWFTNIIGYAQAMWANVKPIFDLLGLAFRGITGLAAGIGAGAGAFVGNIQQGLTTDSQGAVDVGDAFLEAFQDPFGALEQQAAGNQTNVYINQQVSRDDVTNIINEGNRAAYRAQ